MRETLLQTNEPPRQIGVLVGAPRCPNRQIKRPSHGDNRRQHHRKPVHISQKSHHGPRTTQHAQGDGDGVPHLIKPPAMVVVAHGTADAKQKFVRPVVQIPGLNHSKPRNWPRSIPHQSSPKHHGSKNQLLALPLRGVLRGLLRPLRRYSVRDVVDRCLPLALPAPLEFFGPNLLAFGLPTPPACLLITTHAVSFSVDHSKCPRHATHFADQIDPFSPPNQHPLRAFADQQSAS